VLDLLVLVAGFAVGALAIVGINGVRRGSRPTPVLADRGARSRPAPPSRPYQQPPPAPARSSPPAAPAEHGIRVNRPSPAPPVDATAVAGAGAAAAAAGPNLAKDATRAKAATGRARLEVEGKGNGVDLHDAPVTLGRGSDQVLRIKDTRASRAHAVVRRRSKGRSGWELEDQGSANGTELNGHRIPEGRVAPLQDGDRIGIGDTVVVYSEGGSPPPSSTPPDPETTRVADR
jgi:hypothetical protein